MKLLKLSVLLTLFLFTVSICNAQSKKSKKTLEQKSSEMTGKLNKEVNLTATQISKVKAINTSYLERKKMLDDKIDALKKGKKKLKKERNTKIDTVLTDKQKKKRETLKKKKAKKKK